MAPERLLSHTFSAQNVSNPFPWRQLWLCFCSFCLLHGSWLMALSALSAVFPCSFLQHHHQQQPLTYSLTLPLLCSPLSPPPLSTTVPRYSLLVQRILMSPRDLPLALGHRIAVQQRALAGHGSLREACAVRSLLQSLIEGKTKNTLARDCKPSRSLAEVSALFLPRSSSILMSDSSILPTAI
ncbi:uncharacterized protein LY89DRAFT_492278 [Mollisia scopiformis]|uniref:Uncharacterized protein n=1 Tax=Mollisia scopiformis TaxID=149040 RepID=A0A194XH96_MOLSC|nr:uncharacterized protein LY89DRAFT_492278 [Mollisia scopiformis]KUJ19499.1 hypothetical protein LY89DRAFT_492278 [Mollisia scopiformis]